MIQTKAQRGKVFAQTIWRAAITTIVILLLCVPPVWAAMICSCQAETESLHTCCLISENEQADIEGFSHCKNTQSSSSNSQVRKTSQYEQHAMNCCETPLQSELESAELSSIAPIGADVSHLLPVNYRKQVPQALPLINIPPHSSNDRCIWPCPVG